VADVKYTKVWTDGHGNYVLETQIRNGLRYGVLVNASGATYEQPVDTITRFMPYSDFRPLDGPLPPAVQAAIDKGIPENPEPPDL
jgi:hypothetical protein